MERLPLRAKLVLLPPSASLWRRNPSIDPYMSHVRRNTCLFFLFARVQAGGGLMRMRSLKPEYQEKPLSLLSPIILSAGLVLWVWQDWWEASFIPLPKTREYLFKSGWKPTPGHFSLNRLWVETQLYETLSLSDDLCTPTEIWYL